MCAKDPSCRTPRVYRRRRERPLLDIKRMQGDRLAAVVQMIEFFVAAVLLLTSSPRPESPTDHSSA